MDAKKFFKSMVKVTAQDAIRGPLQFIHTLQSSESREVIVATDGWVLAIATVLKTDIETAIQSDIIVRIENEFGTFYIDRKRKALTPTQYPDVYKIIPSRLGPVTEETGIRAMFADGTMKRAKDVFAAHHDHKDINAWVPNYYPVRETAAGTPEYDTLGIHVRIEPGLLIGVMPVLLGLGNEDRAAVIENLGESIKSDWL